jgi:hypothetical protein
LKDLDYRQKIFEEEIINRIKEIQRYVKSLHLTLKKTQSSLQETEQMAVQTKEQMLRSGVASKTQLLLH